MDRAKKRKNGREDETKVVKKNKIEHQNFTPSQTLYIKNLNDQINGNLMKHCLYLLFSTYGDIIDIQLNFKRKKMRGQAHLIFSNIESATMAMKLLQNEQFFHKPLVINYSCNTSNVITRVGDTTEI